MSFTGSPTREPPIMWDSHGADYRRLDSYSTARIVSHGSIDSESRYFTPVDLDRDGFDLQLPPPTKVAVATRPAFGARLLSSISSAQPAVAALTRKGSVLHSRAKSLAAFVPKLSSSTTTITTTPEKAQTQQQRHPVFGDLFNGESAPVRLGIPQSPTKEETEEFVMDYKSAFTQRPSVGPRRRSTAQATPLSTPSPAPKSSWFTRKSLAPTPTQLPPPTPPQQRAHDDLLTLNLHTALFPTGPADPLSPHAFNDLLLNATSLLQRLQAAYREKVEFIAAVRPELEAQREEVEEAETRAEHLRLQLEAMGRVVGEKIRGEEGAGGGVRMVRRSVGGGEEEEETSRRRKRGSAESASDSGFESDVEYAESITSAGGGAETPLSPTPLMTLTPAYDGRDWAPSRPRLSRLSTMSGDGYSAMAYNGGKGAAAAEWTSAEELRGENARLRLQVEEMQRSLQGCIDFVGGVKA
ncbi:hypothetical protein LTR91_010454 [Friedmanniomyces endolithicus]|uniref:Uncharacterized protein n=1 Tax=Friedmanniomyces endolithicus TaxID=329885 RepID=A0AAN6FWQ6_9PEZI|nr:hypothetical protein LTR35_001176 [Friedmanniomyces endolithicus]KAK0296578.1 hypothetical protein LTS00_004903 [Friedmanniomyces endolithicus]KAK0324730.1 hypothetical protein LTR82_004435 [Friedmanniomyces endolithicus]KAK0932205.1 hypothetical protein LTR57_000425 [Friedmanniomyces endolithicus]KAK0985872.1 hypothetical protein LTR91_010454 [Friedmanniomyces endolithicus]